MSTDHHTPGAARTAVSAERTAAFVAFAKRARSRAEQSARIAQEHSDRVEAAYRYAERAAARITGQSPDPADPMTGDR